MKHVLVILGSILFCLACGFSSAIPPVDPPGLASTFSFGVMGDAPYSSQNESEFPYLVDSINVQSPDFVIHVGDIKDSGTECSDSLYANRFDALKSIASPLIYVPGDNEWTDCHREPRNVNDPLERLSALRKVFYPLPGRSLGKNNIPLEIQAMNPGWSEFVEHQRWQNNNVLFVTIHMVGSLNGLSLFETRTELHDAEVDRRIGAATAWLRSSFEKARTENVSAVVIATHADPWNIDEDDWDGVPPRTGFEEVLDVLVTESQDFNKPVLIVNGDSHKFVVDRPLVDSDGATVTNVTRLVTYGDEEVGWIEVTVDLENSPRVFSFEGHS